jgi:type I restriction enzyme, S subunit
MNSWPRKKIGDVFQVERGGSPRPIKHYVTDSPDGLNWIKIGDATASGKYIFSTKEKIKKEGLTKTRYVQEGDFLLSNSMSFGRPYILKTNGCIHDGWLVLRDNNVERINTEFLYYMLCSPALFKQFDSLAAGSTVRNLNISLVSSVEIPIPPLQQQQQIVAILDKAFAAIDQAKANVQRNLENAKEIFQSKLNEVFSQKGEGWEENRIGEIMKLEYGKPLDKKFRIIDGEYPVYGANGEKGRANKFYHDKKSIIIGRKGSAGEINLSEDKFWPLDVTYFVAFDEKKHDLKFLYYLLSNNNLTKLAKGVKPGINRNDVYDILVNIPLLEVQKSIANQLDSLKNRIEKAVNLYHLRKIHLEEMKKSILQQAFNGELNTTEA